MSLEKPLVCTGNSATQDVQLWYKSSSKEFFTFNALKVEFMLLLITTRGRFPPILRSDTAGMFQINQSKWLTQYVVNDTSPNTSDLYFKHTFCIVTPVRI